MVNWKSKYLAMKLKYINAKYKGGSNFDVLEEDIQRLVEEAVFEDKVKLINEFLELTWRGYNRSKLGELTETFNRILGVFNPDQIVTEEPGDYKTVMSYTGKDAMAPMSYDAWLKKDKGIERGAAGIKADQHVKLGREYRALKKADKMAFKDESVEEAKPDFLDLDKDGNKTEPMKKAADDKEAKKEDWTQADSDAERFADMNDFEEYRDAVMDLIQDPNGEYKGKSNDEIAQELRDEAKSIGFADVTGGGDRHRSEPEWLEKIADELDGSASEEVEQPTSGMDAPTPADGEGVAPTDLNKVILRIKDLAGIK